MLTSLKLKNVIVRHNLEVLARDSPVPLVGFSLALVAWLLNKHVRRSILTASDMSSELLMLEHPSVAVQLHFICLLIKCLYIM